MGQGETNQDGRVNLVDSSKYTPGTYKLHFEVDKYFQTHGVDAFYPFVEVRQIQLYARDEQITCNFAMSHFRSLLMLLKVKNITFQSC